MKITYIMLTLLTQDDLPRAPMMPGLGAEEDDGRAMLRKLDNPIFTLRAQN